MCHYLGLSPPPLAHFFGFIFKLIAIQNIRPKHLKPLQLVCLPSTGDAHPHLRESHEMGPKICKNRHLRRHHVHQGQDEEVVGNMNSNSLWSDGQRQTLSLSNQRSPLVTTTLN